MFDNVLAFISRLLGPILFSLALTRVTSGLTTITQTLQVVNEDSRTGSSFSQSTNYNLYNNVVDSAEVRSAILFHPVCKIIVNTLTESVTYDCLSDDSYVVTTERRNVGIGSGNKAITLAMTTSDLDLSWITGEYSCVENYDLSGRLQSVVYTEG